MIVKTDAIVLKVQKYLESSAIVTLYTRGFGKMVVIAKGARRRNSTLASALGVMNDVAVVVYKKEGRDLQTLSQCELRNSWRAMTNDIDRIAAGLAMVELVHLATHFDERHEELYKLLSASLSFIDNATNAPRNALYYFYMHLLETLGFKPAVIRCVKCARDPVERMSADRRQTRASIVDDGILCPSCAAVGIGGPELSGESVQVLRRCQELASPEAAERITISMSARAEVESATRWLLRRHVTGARELKTEKVFSSMEKLSH
jgi:DNA repair protein RecO (recombination protein O)